MSGTAEFEALGAIGSAYLRWSEANGHLDEHLGIAAAHGAPLPADALDADFQASLDVTRAVIAFAATCPPGGPHLDGLRNAAFIQAMFQAVTPQLAVEIDQLTHEWAAWLPEAGQWAPVSGAPPPPRPTSPAHSHLLATVDAWWDAEQDSMRDHVIEIFTQAGGAVTDKTMYRGPAGQIIERTRVEFPQPAPTAQWGIVERVRRIGRRRRGQD